MGSSSSRSYDDTYGGYVPQYGGYYPQGSYSSGYSSGSSRKTKKTKENQTPMYYLPAGYQTAYPTAYPTVPYYPQQYAQPAQYVQDPPFPSTSESNTNAGPVTMPVPEPAPTPAQTNGPVIPSPRMREEEEEEEEGTRPPPSGDHTPFDSRRDNPLPEPPRPVEIPSHLISGTAVTPSGPPQPNHTRRSRLAHPLPPPPQDVYDTRRYRELTEGLATRSGYPLKVHPDGWSNRGGSSLGHAMSKLRHGGGGLLRSFSSSSGKKRRDPIPFGFDSPSPYGQPGQQPSPPLQRSATGTFFPQPGPFIPIPAPMPPPTPPPPVKFDKHTNLTGLSHLSPHKILYKHKLYPTALHLFEAYKFLGRRGDLAERVRTTERAGDLYALTAGLQQNVRGDWQEVMRDKMEKVLYMKFVQHPDLRALLLETGTAELIYSDRGDPFWGDGPVGQGANELGVALVHVRDRLRREGAGR